MFALPPFLFRRSSLLRLTSIALLVSCNVYDESLLPDEPADGTTGGGPGVGGIGTGNAPGDGGGTNGDGGNGNGNGGTGGDGGTGGNGDTGGTGASSSGGSGGTGGTGGTGGGGQIQLTLIADMEAGNNTISLPGGGYWFTTGIVLDCITPNETGGGKVDAAELPESRQRTDEPDGGESLFAMHFVGTDCEEWAQAGFDLKASGPYDASEFDGVALWARLGSEGGYRTLLVELADVSTHPDGGLCDEEADDNAEKCFGHYRATKQLSTDPSAWTFFKIPFTSFGPAGFGYHETDTPNSGQLYQLLFRWEGSNAADFDVWIDDIYFYKE